MHANKNRETFQENNIHQSGTPKYLLSTVPAILDDKFNLTDETSAAPDSHFDIDPHTYELLDTLINCIFLNVVSLFGVLGNVLNILVLRLHNLNESTTMVLLSLAVVDLVCVLTTPVRRSHCLISVFDVAAAQTVAVFDRIYLSTINRLAVAISTSHVVLISIERTVAVYLPFQVSTVFSTSRTRFYLASMYIFWIVLKIPFFDGYMYEWSFDERLNRTVGKVVNSQFRNENYAILSLLNMITSNIRGPVNVFIVLLCSVLTGFKLYIVSIRRSEISSMKQNVGVDMKVVKMLLVVSVVYLSIGIPIFIPYVFFFYVAPEAFRNVNGSQNNLYKVVDYVIDLLYVLNCSVNFLIYVKMSSKFSKTFRKIIGCTTPVTGNDVNSVRLSEKLSAAVGSRNEK